MSRNRRGTLVTTVTRVSQATRAPTATTVPIRIKRLGHQVVLLRRNKLLKEVLEEITEKVQALRLIQQRVSSLISFMRR
jgi:hypothetical protein